MVKKVDQPGIIWGMVRRGLKSWGSGVQCCYRVYGAMGLAFWGFCGAAAWDSEGWGSAFCKGIVGQACWMFGGGAGVGGGEFARHRGSEI